MAARGTRPRPARASDALQRMPRAPNARDAATGTACVPPAASVCDQRVNACILARVASVSSAAPSGAK